MAEPLHITRNLSAAQVAAEMSRLLAYLESDAETLPAIYQVAVENLSRKEEK